MKRKAGAKPAWWRGVPIGAPVLAALWLVLVGSAIAVETRTGARIPLCHVRAATGLPCATCGSTRAVLALADGRIGSALAFNPLVTILVAGAPVLLIAARPLSRAARTRPALAWCAAGLLFAANWGYVAVAELRRDGHTASTETPATAKSLSAGSRSSETPAVKGLKAGSTPSLGLR